MNFLVYLVMISAGLYGLICLTAYCLQSRLLFRPTRELERTPQDFELKFTDEWVETGHGERVHGWHIPCPNARAQVLFLHGNEGNIAHRIKSFALLHGLGLDVMAIDYPGYGQSSGTPSEAGCTRSARAFFESMKSARPDLPIIVWGRSLGGGVATALVGMEGLHLMVLEATFTCMPRVAQECYPWLPARKLSRFKFNSEQRLAGVQVPVLIVHSREDEVIPFAHGEALFEATAGAGTLAPILGTHGGGYFTSGELYLTALGEFLDRNLPVARKGERFGAAGELSHE